MDIEVLAPATLVAALTACGVPFLASNELPSDPPPLAPAALMEALAQQPEARLHLALIPLLLVHPGLAPEVPALVAKLAAPAREHLRCFYTAARLMQEQHQENLTHRLGLQAVLPGLFGPELGLLPKAPVAERLAQLGERHALLVNLDVNWTGSYHYAAMRLLKRLTCEAAWSSAVP